MTLNCNLYKSINNLIEPTLYKLTELSQSTIKKTETEQSKNNIHTTA